MGALFRFRSARILVSEASARMHIRRDVHPRVTGPQQGITPGHGSNSSGRLADTTERKTYNRSA